MRFEKIFLMAMVFTQSATITWSQAKNHPKLWYKEPANATEKDKSEYWSNDPEWLKALPIGNGFMGAMVFGDVNKERIQLNEKTLFSGSPNDDNNPEASKYLPEIRSLLFAGKYKEGTKAEWREDCVCGRVHARW